MAVRNVTIGHSLAQAELADFRPPDQGVFLQLRAGFELIYRFPQPTPVILLVNIHDSRASDIVAPDSLVIEPAIPIADYRDVFGNQCKRVLAPAGRIRLSTNCVIRDSGKPDERVFAAGQDTVEDLPQEVLMFLLGSRYCETDKVSEVAWRLFSHVAPGYPRVQAICDYVHDQIAFNYQNASPTRSALEALNERTGVCRDYAHLAIALCRCMNIPARYCT
ncbi:MAG TPA: transglutaminase family protein, partial [Terriglobia bacterium]|nr:transglutaminase family protein [Terriglobia bacterium]